MVELEAMFAPDAVASDYYYCFADSVLKANLPASADEYYSDGIAGGLDAEYYWYLPTRRITRAQIMSSLHRSADHASRYPHPHLWCWVTPQADIAAVDSGRLYAADIGVLIAAANVECTHPPPSPPSPPPPFPPGKAPSPPPPPPDDDGLSGGELAGIIVGAIGGAILLALVGYVVYVKMIKKESKPIFACLESDKPNKPMDPVSQVA